MRQIPGNEHYTVNSIKKNTEISSFFLPIWMPKDESWLCIANLFLTLFSLLKMVDHYSSCHVRYMGSTSILLNGA